MPDPKIVTDADTVARLHSAALAIRDALGDDQIVLIEPAGERVPVVACVGERLDDGSWVGVAIEGGDVWHYDPDTDVGTPAAAVVPVPVHDGPADRHLVDGYICVCVQPCCSADDDLCICRYGCTSQAHLHG